MEVARLFALGHGARAVATYLGLSHTTMRQWQDAYRQGRLLHSGDVREIKIYPQQLKVAAVEKFLAGTSPSLESAPVHFLTSGWPPIAKTDQPALLPGQRDESPW